MKDLKIGKFDIFAVYMYAKGLSQGMSEKDAKVYGFSIAVLGARAKMGGAFRKSGSKSKKSDAQVLAQAAGKKKKKGSITVEDYEKLAGKLGSFYSKFEKRIKKVVKQGVSYEALKEMVEIPPRVGAKITANDFMAKSK